MTRVCIISSLLLLFSCAEQQESRKLQLNTIVNKVEIVHPLPGVDVLVVIDKESIGSFTGKNLLDQVGFFLEPLWSNRLVDVRVGGGKLFRRRGLWRTAFWRVLFEQQPPGQRG